MTPFRAKKRDIILSVRQGILARTGILDPGLGAPFTLREDLTVTEELV